MSWFNHWPGFRRSPAGRERTVLRRLPALTLWGSLLLALPSLAARLLGLGEAAWLGLLDIYAIALLILHWTVVLTVAIGAFIVLVMKGPAYVADPYPLDDYDPPPEAGPR